MIASPGFGLEKYPKAKGIAENRYRNCEFIVRDLIEGFLRVHRHDVEKSRKEPKTKRTLHSSSSIDEI